MKAASWDTGGKRNEGVEADSWDKEQKIDTTMVAQHVAAANQPQRAQKPNRLHSD
jgi:hypothetical protein